MDIPRIGGYDDRNLLDDTHNNHHGSAKPTPRMARSNKKPISRRNTVSVMFDELLANADNIDTTDQGKRSDKRSMQLLRGSERDLKLDIVRAQNITAGDVKEIDVPPQTPQPSMQVESSKHFKSLCSKRVLCSRRQVRSVSGSFATADLLHIGQCPPSRVDFHKTLSMLIRMGSNENKQVDRNCRRNLSREEHMWQNEVKDLIWLELQAWHANRSLTDEDNYLCLARDSVGSLLNEIMMYRFRRHKKRISAHSIDSGVGTEDCTGCLSLGCSSCLEAQNEGLRDVEELLCRLQTAESLFPSSRAFAESYPLYDSSEFVGRVKAMCLWYNMTKHQRLKLSIMAKLLRYYENKLPWPMSSSDGYTADSTSPSDSNSSNSSINEYFAEIPTIDCATYLPLPCLLDRGNSPYRQYIENILKTRGLEKSMKFLDKLHNSILHRVQVTLEKPEEDIFQKEPEDNADDELKRYGCWSPEAQSLGLPSYKAIFLYLASLPLRMVHEFLLMRLEQKPTNPSPLSVRQLMRELKEGLRMCTKHRERIIMNFHVGLTDNEEHKGFYVQALDALDKSLLSVFEDYLEYLKTWALLQHDNFQKNLLEEEWKFICDILPNIIGGRHAAIRVLCSIIGNLLQGICQRVMEHIEEAYQEVKAEGKTISKSLLFVVCRDLQALFGIEREMLSKTMAFSKMIMKAMKASITPELIYDFKDNYLKLRCTIPLAIERAQNICDMLSTDNLDEFEKAGLQSRCREILMQCFRFGFEFHKEMSDFIPQERRKQSTCSMIQFAHLWMKFTQERCERGRGKRPRWANQGLEFLLTVCEPQNTMYLTDEEFEELKKNMDGCISHVIGSSGPLTPESGIGTASPKLSVDLGRHFSRSRGCSPNPRPTFKSQRSSTRKKSADTFNSSTPGSENGELSPQFLKKCDSLQEGLTKVKSQAARRSERLLQAVEQLDTDIDNKLRDDELIGHVISNSKDNLTKAHIRRRYVTFSWQRGIKIGQGRFGKVYTAVNNDNGEMMAVKEITIQPNDCLTIRKVCEELKILEGINHRNVIRYYGLEVHKEEMLIFMEFCPEGTLESLVAGTENGLPEVLIRRYTYQLICGVAKLHEHGIVHRDIKPANIFLSEEGNCLKIGDFGCAVKIKSHVTMPGELQGFVGTQAYMAPEMFMKTQVNGHGRAADVWSVGCVVVEMASGKRPWAEFDSNYQIMFKVGMGDRPEAPDTLIDEGHDFLDRCLQHNAKDRATACELLDHAFVKVGSDIN